MKKLNMEKAVRRTAAMLLAAALAACVLAGCASGSSPAKESGVESGAQAGTGARAENEADARAERAPEDPAQSGARGETGNAAQAATAAAAKSPAESAAEGRQEPLRIVTTIFPEYDWVRNLLGDRAANAQVTMLLDNSIDLHSYQPTAADILRIAECDLFIYVGGESDDWVEDALEQAVNKDMVALNMLEALGDAARQEEFVEGMQAEEEEEEDGEEEPELDEHVWLSLRNASTLCEAISGALCRIDPAGADVYTANLTAYEERLRALDAEYEKAAAEAEIRTVLFGDRFPFRYMMDDYGLDYYAAFAGCSAETEASFETVLFLAGKVDELSLHSVMTIEGGDHRIAETIVQNTGSKDQQILEMDSMQSTTSKDVQEGADYVSIMEKNLEALRDALQ